MQSFVSRRAVLRSVGATGLAGLAGCFETSEELPHHIAHAMGGIDGEDYTNSLEAWETNYEKGCRCFEVDFWRASDDELVAYHDGLRGKYGLPEGFSSEQFTDSKFAGKYTPLDAEGIASLMQRATDWRLVTDFKNGFRSNLRRLVSELDRSDIDYRERVLPQIYNVWNDMISIEPFEFENVIFTLYRSALTDERVVDAVENYDAINAVTMSEKRYSVELVSELNDIGVAVYVHTVNRKADIEEYLDSGVRGVYTDFACR